MADGSAEELERLIARVPEGWTRFVVGGQPWAVSRVTRADGRVVTLEADRLGGREGFGANVWLTSSGAVLKPCEVPAATVLGLLRALPSVEQGRDRGGDDGERGGSGEDVGRDGLGARTGGGGQARDLAGAEPVQVRVHGVDATDDEARWRRAGG